MRDMSVLDNLLIGRVEPHIYAFSTNTIPNYLKVGDTYRPVPVRLKEWQRHFPELQQQFSGKAKVSDSVYFRDFSVHQFLLDDRGRVRLQPEDLPDGVYYSNEFFKNATAADVADAISDITRDYTDHANRYQFYSAETQLPAPFRYPSTGVWTPRPNQEDTINAFKTAVENGRTNLLMYAVMRFGKSFTSMCCAVAMEAKYVVVVSAKADVMEEWKKTVESADNFSQYVFLRPEDVRRNYSIVTDTLNDSENPKRVVLFLTLQDLQGDDIKEKHEQVFAQAADLLIIDETHFGARAEKYGAVLKGATEKVSAEEKGTIDDVIDASKSFSARIQLHLSGTPYRILMGSEFSKEDIIAFYQFTDIVKAQEEWDAQNFASETPKEEWANPYYGFPQMVRFAFNPNESSRRRLESLRAEGISCSLSTLLTPESVTKKPDGSHKVFTYAQEVLDLLEVIDGSKEDEEVLGFLDYDRIKEGKMCRHVVCVLPYCASCDALEALIKSNAHRFKNLQDYEIINISGIERPKAFNTPKDIKKKIADCEAADKKTLTLTVNRMLTGSTVEQWDTMLFLKDTASPQEYDQAIFRLQNQYIKTYKSSNGQTIKYNMKPQTLLVDFDPNRVFVMQEQKAQVYNVNTDESGNTKLGERLQEELRISPVIVMNKDSLKQVDATDILHYVSEYSRNRGVAEEATEIPVDLALLNIEAIRNAISRENELGSKAGLTILPIEDDGDDLDIPETEDDSAPQTNTSTQTDPENQPADGEESMKDPAKQFRSYYARILFFAFLTKDVVISLDDILSHFDTDDNIRIARNLGITRDVLSCISENADKFMLRKLDYKIQNLNQLSHDENLDAIERASVAINKFGKIGESEVITPKALCTKMVALLPENCIREAVDHGRKFLDIAGKAGEFAIALYQRCLDLGYGIDALADIIYTVPTSKLTYEFNRMVYEILGLNITNLAAGFTSYDMLTVTTPDGKNVDYRKLSNLLCQNVAFSEITMNDVPSEGDDNVQFGAIVGNPPYQASGGSGGTNDAPIYQHFASVAEMLTPRHISLIIPSRWFSGGRDNLLADFRKNMLTSKKIRRMYAYTNSQDVFPAVEIKGGLCYYLYDQQHNGSCEYTIVQNGTERTLERNLDDFDVLIREPILSGIVKKVMDGSPETVEAIISSDTPFGIPTNPKGSKKNPFSVSETSNDTHNVKLFYIDNSKRKTGYVQRIDIKKNCDAISKEKVFIPKGYGAGETFPHQILGIPEFAGANTVCSQSYLFAAFDTEEEAKNFVSYMRTKFFRALVLSVKISQDAMSKTYRFVPMQDYTKAWTDEELYSKYGLSVEEIAYIEATIKPMPAQIT